LPKNKHYVTIGELVTAEYASVSHVCISYTLRLGRRAHWGRNAGWGCL